MNALQYYGAFLAACLASLGAMTVPAEGAVHYVAADGADDRDGRSPEQAWQTLARVNAAKLKPGDHVLFRRGDTWRGQLVPRSGTAEGAIFYGAFGSGPRPLLLGSVAKNDPGGWQLQEGSVWVSCDSVRAGANLLANPSLTSDAAGWSLHVDPAVNAKGARDTAEFDSTPASYRVECTKPGKGGSQIQLAVGPIQVKRGQTLRLVFRAKADMEVLLSAPTLHKNGPPWTPYAAFPPASKFRLGSQWTTCTQFYQVTASAADARLTFYLGNLLPAGSTLHLDSFELAEATAPELLLCDVGNIIFDDGASCGVKVFHERDLDAPGKFWYDQDRHVVKLFSKDNPAREHRKIECALGRHIISQGNTSYVTYEGLALKYGAAHGIGGGNTAFGTVRDCEFGFIGGASQYGGSRTVRYGNGVEFWGNAHDHLVERCRFYEIYDAALTNQNQGQRAQQYNITYRYNVIANSEYSFEYWNRPADSRTWNIRFENNTCLHAGGGWGHAQRPDPSGHHLSFHDSPAAAENIVIRNNIFYEAKTNGFYAPSWPRASLAALKMDRNCWYQPAGTMIRLKEGNYPMVDFARYQAKHSQGPNSLAADPLFADLAKGDHRLKPGSPCLNRGAPVDAKADFQGIPLPAGQPVDLGAYQHHP